MKHKGIFLSFLLSIFFISQSFCMEKEVEIVSSDSQKFKIKRKIALSSKLIKSMLEGDDEEIPSIPIRVKAKKFKKVFSLMKKLHKLKQKQYETNELLQRLEEENNRLGNSAKRLSGDKDMKHIFIILITGWSFVFGCFLIAFSKLNVQGWVIAVLFAPNPRLKVLFNLGCSFLFWVAGCAIAVLLASLVNYAYQKVNISSAATALTQKQPL